MKKFLQMGGLAAVTLLFALGAAAQHEGVIRGQVKDQQGKPWPGATIIIKHEGIGGGSSAVGRTEGVGGGTGRTYELKTDRSGNFVQAGLPPGIYGITVRAVVQGETEPRDIYEKKHQLYAGRDDFIDLDLQKLMAEQQEASKELAEEMKKFDDMKANFDAGSFALEQAKQLQAQMRTTPRAERAPLQQQFDQQRQSAVTSLQTALEKITNPKDSNLHLVLAKLGEAYEIAERFEDAAGSYQRAVELNPDPRYYNNLGNSLAKAGKIEEATQAYQKSAELNPSGAAQAWTNLGIVLQNSGKPKEAVEPLRKALAADSNYALAWYVLGSALLGQVETRQEGDKLHYIVPPGTAEAYQKYLELAPNGPYATEAKSTLQALESMGASIDLKYRRGKKSN